jgi:hypothetical protein
MGRMGAGAVPGFFLDLTPDRVGGVLAWVGPSGGYFPAPCAGDEPVPAYQQDPVAPVGHDACDRGTREMHDVMLEPLPAGDLDVVEGDPDPFAGVDVATPMDGPAHEGQPSVPEAAAISASRARRSLTGRASFHARRVVLTA